MIIPVYSIRDNVSGMFDSPVLNTNDYTMMRGLAEQIINGNMRNILFSPKDYDLYKIGQFDIDKGSLIPKVPVELISNCVEVINNYGYKKE